MRVRARVIAIETVRYLSVANSGSQKGSYS